MIRFLSTPSARRATQSGRPDRDRCVISIHALREEGDSAPAWRCSPHSHFYPRPPRGGRRTSLHRRACPRYFYPRPPRGGRRCPSNALLKTVLFLSTPSARRATRILHHSQVDRDDFYPRPPRGGRRRSPTASTPSKNFYPRPPRGGRHPGRWCRA